MHGIDISKNSTVEGEMDVYLFIFNSINVMGGAMGARRLI